MVSTTVGNILAIAVIGVLSVAIVGYVYLAYGPQIKDAIDKLMSGELRGSLSEHPILGQNYEPKGLLSSRAGYYYSSSSMHDLGVEEERYEP